LVVKSLSQSLLLLLLVVAAAEFSGVAGGIKARSCVRQLSA
jgi:hypothetical protein